MDKDKYSYFDLLTSINKTDKFPLVCKKEDPYNIFLHLIISLLNDKELILLDSDFSSHEMDQLLGNNDDLNISFKNNFKEIESINEMIKTVLNAKKWKITLFTSGTTGLPKKVVHSFLTLIRSVQTSDRHDEDVWGFAYNPTHIAGLQVFFQAFLNQNPIINLFGKNSNYIKECFNQYQISHISATPTFYRMFEKKDVFESVRRVTSGGERLDKPTEKKIQQTFPKAKLRNVYASTEAGTILSAKGDVFEIMPGMKDVVKIEDSEILVHKTITGIPKFDQEWYKTGDVVEIINENPLQFKIVNRKNEMINVGGMKVNPNEVEIAMKDISEISDVLVYGKPNPVIGTILCADVVGYATEKDIKLTLKKSLQSFKIPRIINFVDKIKTTRTGKKQR
ncbi:MAG: ANL family adenylate-forming protein [bacterium]